MTRLNSFLPETETAVPIVHASGSGRQVGVLGHRSTFKVESAETGGVYAILVRIMPAHCTGWRAVHALLNKFGERVVTPSAVGSHFTFTAA